MCIKKQKNIVIPTNDYVFKKIFGQVGNESITKSFISAIIDKKIESIELEENTFLDKEIFDDKLGILDIKAKLDNQIVCDIEMQVINQKNIEKRILFYWSKLYISGIKKGEDYRKLNKTISILLINYELDNLRDILKGHTEWKIREKDFKNTVLTEMLEIHIIELPKIEKIMKTSKFKNKDLISWIKFIMMPNDLEEKDMDGNEALKKAKEELEKIQNDDYERRIAELRMKHILDTNSIKADGYEEGLEKGVQKGKKEIAKKLLAKKYSIEDIIELTGLSKEDLESL